MTARRVFVLGATGTIGQAVVRALVEQGDEVVCLVRPGHAERAAGTPRPLIGAQLREGLATDAASLRAQGLRGERFDSLISCLASRTGAPADAWAIDYRAHSQALLIAREAGIGHIIQLSAICVQRPLLAFQQAKLAFEPTHRVFQIAVGAGRSRPSRQAVSGFRRRRADPMQAHQ